MKCSSTSPTPVRDADALAKVKGVGRDTIDRRGADMLAAIERGLAIPDSELPRVERPARRAADPAYEARVEALKQVRNARAQHYQLAPGVLCPNGTLEAIAAVMPKDSTNSQPSVRCPSGRCASLVRRC